MVTPEFPSASQLNSSVPTCSKTDRFKGGDTTTGLSTIKKDLHFD